MKVIHITAKVLLKIASIALIALVAISVIPIVAGGIGLDMKEDPKATLNGDTVEITGTFVVENNLMWDITDFTYGLTIKNDIFTAVEVVKNDITISKGAKTELKFEVDMSFADLMLMMIGGGVEPGGTIGSLKIPLSLNIGGSYIQGLIGFNVTLAFSVELDTPAGTVDYDQATGQLSGEITFDTGGILGGMTDVDLDVPITVPGSDPAVSGNVKISVDSAGNAKVTFDLGLDTPGHATAEELLDAMRGSAVEIGGVPLTPEQSEQFVDMIEHILDMIEGGP